MFVVRGAILLLWALKVWRSYFLGWNICRGGFSHPGCCSGCAGQPGESQCLSCLQPCVFVLRTLQWALLTPARHSLPRAGLAPGLPEVFPMLLPAPGAPVVLFPPTIFSCAVGPAVPVWHAHVSACAACDPAGPSQLPPHTLRPAGFTRLWAVASLPSRKSSNFILELILKLTAAQSLTAVLMRDLKLLDSVTLSSLGRSGFIIIVSKGGLGDY